MPRPAPAIGWRVLLAAQVLGVFWLAFTPDPPAAASTGWDKANHALAFAVMAFTACQAFAARPRRAFEIIAGLAAFGAFIEVVQTFVPGRSGEWPDLAADAVGIAIGLLMARAWTSRPPGA